MRAHHIYWHIYPQDQIKPELRGGLIFVLEVPWEAGSPVVRDIVDTTGRDFPARTRFKFPSLPRPDYHGIMYVGVNKPAVYDLMLLDPQIIPENPDYSRYNAGIIANARNFFLRDPNRGFKALPQHLAQLL